MAAERLSISNRVKMGSINVILFLVWMCFASTYGQPLKTADDSSPKYDLPITSESPLKEIQRNVTIGMSTRKPASKDLPINKEIHEIHEQVLAIFGNNSIVTKSSFVKFLNEIFAAATNSSEKSPTTTNNSTVNELSFLEIFKEIFPPETFSADSPGNSTSTSIECEDYEDKADYEDDEVEDVTYPDGLGPRLSATLLKILTF